MNEKSSVKKLLKELDTLKQELQELKKENIVLQERHKSEAGLLDVESRRELAMDRLEDSEKKLKREMEFTKTALNAQLDTFFVFDPENGKIVRWNKTFEKISEYTAEEIKSLPAPSSYYSKEDLERAIAFINEASDKGFGQINLDLISKSGKIIPFEYSISRMYDVVDEKEYLVSVGRDISEWKEAQKILVNNKNQLQGLFDHMMNGFAYHQIVSDDNLNPVDYIYLEVNKSFEKYTGLKKDNIIGKRVTEVIPEIKNDSTDWIQKYADVATSGNLISFESYSEGINKWFRINAYSIEKGYFATTFEDITENKKSELLRNVLYNIALSVNKSKSLVDLTMSIKKELSNIVDTSNFYIALYNNEKDTLNFPLHIDKKDKIANECPASKTLTKYVIDNDKSQLLRNKDIVQLITNGSIVRVASPSKCWLGVPLRFKNEVIGALGLQSYENEDAFSKEDVEILEFVSEHIATSIMLKNAQDLLADNESRYRTLANATNEAIFISEKGICIDTNEAAIKLFGYSYDELIGIFGTDVIAPESKELVKKNMMRGTTEPYEAVALRKDDTRFPGLFQGMMFEYRGKEARLTTCRDLTEQKKFEKEIIEAKEKAEESDKLKSAFLANMSHEIRTPLNGILGFSSIICDQEIEEDKREKYVEIINNCGDQLLSIINNVLDISRMETGQIELNVEVFNLNAFMKNQFELFNSKCKEKDIVLGFSNSLSDKDSDIKTDKVKLNQVLSNLLGNAVKFTGKGEISFGYYVEDKKIIFFVKDTGIGIPEEKVNFIFERFQQADFDSTRMYGGAGLGLAITKNLVQILGGDIEVDSKINEGSEFKFHLPVDCFETLKDERKPKEKFSHNKLIHGDARKILVAEDEESNFIFVNEVIKLIKFNVIHAANGEKAIELTRENPDISLILMDMKMPGINGFEATKIIKKEFPDIPIIAQTAYAFSGDKEKAMQAGCDDYISKPIMKNELIEVIGKFINLS